MGATATEEQQLMGQSIKQWQAVEEEVDKYQSVLNLSLVILRNTIPESYKSYDSSPHSKIPRVYCKPEYIENLKMMAYLLQPLWKNNGHRQRLRDHNI